MSIITIPVQSGLNNILLVFCNIMEFDFLLLGRIMLTIISIIVLGFIFKARLSNRLGNQFFSIMLIFWTGVIAIAIQPSLLDSVLNNTGFVNRAQFLLAISMGIIVYLLAIQTRKSKSSNESLNKVIRKIALDIFKKEYAEIQKSEVIILIAAKDEEKNIGYVIDNINKQKISKSYKILVVNDGSGDMTEKIVRDKRCLVVNHYHNLGVGGATKTGYLACSVLNPEIIITIDADGQHNPSHITEMIDKINEGFDMVSGSRFAEGSTYESNTIRLVGNKFYTNLVNKLGKISITDVTSGYRALRADKMKSVYYNAETNFAIELVLRAAKNGLKITEIPTKAEIRIHGQSQLHRIEKFLGYNINAMIQIFNAYFRKAIIPE